MLDPIQLLAEVRSLGANKTLADVEAALAQYDYKALKTQERTRYRVEIWNETDPINGIAPDVILQDVPKHPNGEYGKVYLIYIDGNLVYLQKHDPEQVGFVPMDEATALEKANKIVDVLVEQAVDARVRQEVLRQLLAG